MLEQITVTGHLEALSPLHIGTGEFERLDSMRTGKDVPQAILEAPDSADKLKSLVSKVVRDFEGLPCIPGTTLKGCLQAACREVGFSTEERQAIFGEITQHKGKEASAEEETGRMGAVRFLLARMDKQSIPAESDLPFYVADEASYILTRVATDRDSGTAEDKKLFNQELVPQGTRFGLRLHFTGSMDAFQERVKPLLDLMAGTAGIPLGKGQGLSQGRVRLLEQELLIQHIWFDAQAFSQETENLTIDLQPNDAPGARLTRKLRLTCKGPYLIHDPCRAGKKKTAEPSTQTLQSGPGQPLLLPSSLLGVLRSRMAWAQAQQMEQPCQDCDEIDNRFRRPDWKKPDKLTTTERLFGVTGWRKLLEVAEVKLVDGGQECDLTSVALDRFSAAPIDNALFTTRAYRGVEFLVTLALALRRFRMPEGKEALSFGRGNQEDEEAFHALIDQVCQEEVLMLGHGVNKGFGWFTVKEVRDA
ncbi:MAG: RAMP superfamily CRISPR-associated protein [Pseudomonadota bacterium]